MTCDGFWVSVLAGFFTAPVVLFVQWVLKEAALWKKYGQLTGRYFQAGVASKQLHVIEYRRGGVLRIVKYLADRLDSPIVWSSDIQMNPAISYFGDGMYRYSNLPNFGSHQICYDQDQRSILVAVRSDNSVPNFQPSAYELQRWPL